MSTPAWQVRSGARKRLINKWIDQGHKLQEEFEDELFFFNLALFLIEYLKGRQAGIEDPKLDEGLDGKTMLFFGTVLVSVRSFARTPIERDALVTRFLEEVLKSVVIPFQSKLLKQEIEHPKLVFHASSAMTKVPFEEEQED